MFKGLTSKLFGNSISRYKIETISGSEYYVNQTSHILKPDEWELYRFQERPYRIVAMIPSDTPNLNQLLAGWIEENVDLTTYSPTIGRIRGSSIVYSKEIEAGEHRGFTSPVVKVRKITS